MKISSMHRLPRSIAHSAAAAVVCLAAALTSASPALADTAPPPDLKGVADSQCVVRVEKKQGLDGIIWTLMFGTESTRQENCSAEAEAEAQDPSVADVARMP
ncbi:MULTISPECIES: hypothetical protein [Streptomyces]|nr:MULTISPECIES: hypothetical protein [Streptomyces]